MEPVFCGWQPAHEKISSCLDGTFSLIGTNSGLLSCSPAGTYMVCTYLLDDKVRM
jgi:hypothetical protein